MRLKCRTVHSRKHVPVFPSEVSTIWDKKEVCRRGFPTPGQTGWAEHEDHWNRGSEALDFIKNLKGFTSTLILLPSSPFRIASVKPHSVLPFSFFHKSMWLASLPVLSPQFEASLPLCYLGWRDRRTVFLLLSKNPISPNPPCLIPDLNDDDRGLAGSAHVRRRPHLRKWQKK